MTSQEYIKWLQGFLEALNHVRLDHKEIALALSKIEDKLKEVVDYKQQTILTQPNGTAPYITPHHTGTPFNNPFTINCRTNVTPNTNITI